MTRGILVFGLLCFCFQSQAVEVTATDVVQESVDLTAVSFVGKAAVHSPSYNFRCNYHHMDEAIRLAADTAMFRCLEKGFNSCVVRQSTIVLTGYLGYQDGFNTDLGYGCMARALVHGN